MTITRNHEVMNFETHTNFTLRKLGFLEWIEIHDIARHQRHKETPQLLGNIALKFKRVKSSAAKLNIPLPPEILKLDLPKPEKKKPTQRGSTKRKKINFEQLFVTKEPTVPGGERHIKPPEGVDVEGGHVIH